MFHLCEMHALTLLDENWKSESGKSQEKQFGKSGRHLKLLNIGGSESLVLSFLFSDPILMQIRKLDLLLLPYCNRVRSLSV